LRFSAIVYTTRQYNKAKGEAAMSLERLATSVGRGRAFR